MEILPARPAFIPDPPIGEGGAPEIPTSIERPAAPDALEGVTGRSRPSRRHHVEQLVAHARRMKGRPADEIWATVARRAVEYHRAGGAPPREQLTAVMEDLGAVFNGRDLLRHLDDYCSKARLWRAPEAGASRDRLRALGVGDLAPPAGLDATGSRSFRPEFADGSDNQIYHACFYLVMGYVTRDERAIRLGSIVHEARDGGSSRPDHAVALAAARLGEHLYDTAQASPQQARRVLDTLPAFIGAAFGSRGAAFTLPTDAGPAARAAAVEADRLTREVIAQDRERVDADWNERIPGLSRAYRSRLGAPLRWLLGGRIE